MTTSLRFEFGYNSSNVMLITKMLNQKLGCQGLRGRGLLMRDAVPVSTSLAQFIPVAVVALWLIVQAHPADRFIVGLVCRGSLSFTVAALFTITLVVHLPCTVRMLVTSAADVSRLRLLHNLQCTISYRLSIGT